MEVNDGNLQTLAGYLEQTLSLDPSHRRAGNTLAIEIRMRSVWFDHKN